MIPAKRLDMNQGYGDCPGKWVFDDITFADSLLGKAVVRYGFHVSRNTDRGSFDPLLDTIFVNPQVESIVVFDDAGDEMPVPDEHQDEFVRIVLEIFAGIENCVRDFEIGLL
jgi:hypothetical protein